MLNGKSTAECFAAKPGTLSLSVSPQRRNKHTHWLRRRRVAGWVAVFSEMSPPVVFCTQPLPPLTHFVQWRAQHEARWSSGMALVNGPRGSWMALPVTLLPCLCPGGARRWSRGGGGARPGGGGRIQNWVVRSLPRKSYHHDHSTDTKPKPVFFGLLDQLIHAPCRVSVTWAFWSVLVHIIYMDRTGLCSRHVQLAQADNSCYAFWQWTMTLSTDVTRPWHFVKSVLTSFLRPRPNDMMTKRLHNGLLVFVDFISTVDIWPLWSRSKLSDINIVNCDCG